MVKQVKIYKNSGRDYSLIRAKRVDQTALIMDFENSEDLKRNSLIWNTEDRLRNITQNLLVVNDVLGNGSFLIGLPDEKSVDNLRIFNKDEVFTLIGEVI